LTPVKAEAPPGLDTRVVEVLRTRRVVQWIVTLVVVAIGIQFTLWVVPHLEGRWPSVQRPPGVEAFLPIDAMLGLRHLLLTGSIDAVHPAGLAIFLGICWMSLVFARSFCSHACPVGLLSELLGRLGVRLTGKTLTPWRWIDLPLRSLKFLLLGFFVWAIWFSMSATAVEAFLESPYAKVVDAKMWLFFAEPSRLTVSVIGILLVASVFIRDFWCRYLCPYGALVGVLGVLAPLKITRDPDTCTECRTCSSVCPGRLPVHRMNRVTSVECTGCQDCVVNCLVEGCLRVRPPSRLARRWWLRPAAASLVAIGVYLAVVVGFQATGHWHTSITEAEYNFRLQELDSPIYTHVGGTAMTDDR
jgi:ferredoxin